MSTVRLIQLDGSLPNLALMKFSHWHRARGDEVEFSRSVQPGLLENPSPDLVYGSAIFSASAQRAEQLRAAWPQALLGGTGAAPLGVTVEQALGVEQYEHYDYSIYPDYPWSLGFTQRGCRLNCGFCVVPKKEGRPRSLNTIEDIHRPDSPRAVVLLDNDFFGQPAADWRARIRELRDGNFKVSFNQGVNIRLVDEEAAEALASVRYYDKDFKHRRLYTAWDNLKDEEIFWRGVERLERAGIPPRHLMVYMLVGYRPGETFREVMYRFRKLTEAGCLAYPMVYDRSDQTLVHFQRWVVGRFHEMHSWEDFRPSERHRLRDGLRPPDPAALQLYLDLLMELGPDQPGEESLE